MKTITARELLPQTLLLGPLDRFDRQLIFPSEIQHHIAETLTLQLHQKLDGVASSPAGKAVIELLGGRHRHRRLAVVVKRANADELTPLLLEHNVLTNHINDVGPLLDGFNRAGVEPGHRHRPILLDLTPGGMVER